MKQALFILFAMLSSQWLHAEAIKIAADVWCPYNCEPDSSAPGYIIEVLDEIYRDSNLKVDYQLIPWSRAIDATRRGQLDAIVGAIPLEAPDFIYPESSAGLVRHTFFSRPEVNWQYSGISSLNSIQLGAVQDYSYGEEVTQYIQQNAGSRVTVIAGDYALRSLSLMLRAGRIDALIEDESVYRYYLSNNKEAFDFVPKGISAEEEIYVAFSPNNDRSADLAEAYDKGLAELRESGRLQAILEKYGLRDWYPQ